MVVLASSAPAPKPLVIPAVSGAITIAVPALTIPGNQSPVGNDLITSAKCFKQRTQNAAKHPEDILDINNIKEKL